MAKDTQHVKETKVFYVKGIYVKDITVREIKTALELICPGTVEVKELKPSLIGGIG